MRVIVVGSGSGGATFAGRLARDGRHEVVLVEAGPDYGPFEAQRWPFELLDSRRIPPTHDWGLVNSDPGSGRSYRLERARVMGGCSAHNGCAAVRGVRADFARWSRLAGVDFWNPDDFLEDFRAIDEALRVRRYDFAEITPFQQDFYHACRAAGIPHSQDINDIDEGVAVSVSPVNKHGAVRWNAAFAFVDPVRGERNFSIVDHLTVDSLLLDGRRVCGVRGRRLGDALTIDGDLVVLAAGAYGTPMILLGSGIGDPSTLAEADLPLRHALPGVGRNLQDHPAIVLEYQPRPAMMQRFLDHEAMRVAYDEATIAKQRSPWSEDAFDLHIFSVAGRTPDLAAWFWHVYVALLTPRSRGRIRPWREDGRLRFAIEHNQLTDPQGIDVASLAWGVEEARRIAAQAPFADAVDELRPGPATTGDALPGWIRRVQQHYYHPAGSCPIGTDPAAGAVVDAYGRVHGLEGLMIADASIMPIVTAANTNLPTAALAHRLARHFDDIQALARGG